MSKSPLKQVMLIMFLLVSLTGAAFARSEDKEEHGNRAKTQAIREEKKQMFETRLTENKLKSCKRREAVINKKMSQIAERGQRQLEVFNKISERTQAFYASKGRSAENYDSLLAEVNTKKAAAEAAVAAVKATSVTFNCDGTDPKGAATSFKDALKSETSALKAYKTAVKSLIVGVKSAQTGAGE